MRRVAVVLAALGTLVAPGVATAAEQTLTFTTGPIAVDGYGVAQQPMLAESPKVDGYVVGMEAEVVDAAGRVQGRDKVMLHHIVFAKLGARDTTCGDPAERYRAASARFSSRPLPGRSRSGANAPATGSTTPSKSSRSIRA